MWVRPGLLGWTRCCATLGDLVQATPPWEEDPVCRGPGLLWWAPLDASSCPDRGFICGRVCEGQRGEVGKGWGQETKKGPTALGASRAGKMAFPLPGLVTEHSESLVLLSWSLENPLAFLLADFLLPGHCGRCGAGHAWLCFCSRVTCTPRLQATGPSAVLTCPQPPYM